MDDVKLAVETLQAKAVALTPLFDYYNGNQPLRYAAERLREIFQSRQTTFVQNWCAVVVDAIADRLLLEQVAVSDDDAATAQVQAAWAATGLNEDVEAVERAVLVAGEGYVLAWPLGETGPEAFYHDPRMCHVWYEADNPRQKRLGAKWWRGEDRRWRLNLYYPERIVRYVGGDGDTVRAASFQVESEEGNPAGVVPIVHFCRDRHLAAGVLTNVIPLQDAINKLLGDMMIAAEFGAFRQRWIVTNADTSKLRNAPNEIWEVPAAGPGEQPTTLGEFAPADLGNYLDAIDRLAASIGVITQTPRHYFFQQGGDPSGEALIAMEAPLMRRVEVYQQRLGVGWAEVMGLLTGIEPAAIAAVWAPAATVQPRTQAEIRQIGVSAGMPLTTLLRAEGWTETELAQMEADREAEAGRQQAQLATALMAAQTQFDAGEEG